MKQADYLVLAIMAIHEGKSQLVWMYMKNHARHKRKMRSKEKKVCSPSDRPEQP